ncbi:hypothetical protein BDR26DRAFT_866838 [Obelidium mucronatum]|nr:hypothetical protein BDR26DRAFT_866838 [Obelidium mucronatum]
MSSAVSVFPPPPPASSSPNSETRRAPAAAATAAAAARRRQTATPNAAPAADSPPMPPPQNYPPAAPTLAQPGAKPPQLRPTIQIAAPEAEDAISEADNNNNDDDDDDVVSDVDDADDLVEGTDQPEDEQQPANTWNYEDEEDYVPPVPPEGSRLHPRVQEILWRNWLAKKEKLKAAQDKELRNAAQLVKKSGDAGGDSGGGDSGLPSKPFLDAPTPPTLVNERIHVLEEDDDEEVDDSEELSSDDDDVDDDDDDDDDENALDLGDVGECFFFFYLFVVFGNCQPP